MLNGIRLWVAHERGSQDVNTLFDKFYGFYVQRLPSIQRSAWLWLNLLLDLECSTAVFTLLNDDRTDADDEGLGEYGMSTITPIYAYPRGTDRVILEKVIRR